MVNVSNSAREIIVIIEEILCCLITPFMIYSYIKFNRLSHSVLVQKRHPKILKIAGICSIYWFAITLPIMCIAFAELDQFKGETQIILDRINTFVYPIGTIGCFLAIAWRCWHIYFDLKYSSSQKNSEWKYHLDPSLVEHNFWLKHKKDYGSSAWTKKIVIIYYIVAIFVTCATYQITIDTPYYVFVGHGVSAMQHNFVMTAIIFLYWKMPACTDYFFVREELRKVCVVMFCAMCFTVCALIYGFLVSPVVLMMMCTVAGSVLFSSMVIVSFLYIPNKIRTGESVSENSNSGNNTRKLHYIIANPNTYKQFMQHLAKEFSMECLLCFTEIIQFKCLMLQRLQIIDSETNLMKDVKSIFFDFFCTEPCPLTNTLPISLINQQFEQYLSNQINVNLSLWVNQEVEQPNNSPTYKPNESKSQLMDQSKTIALLLYRKYIQEGSELEVNISYETRSKLSNVLYDKVFWFQSNITLIELFCLYDKVATTMFTLMDNSYIRFKSKPDFKYVIQELNEQRK
eukprot:423187_1